MVGKVTPNDQLSASEIPVLMGASKYKTVNELLKEKIDVLNGIERPFTSNESMEWGNTLETTILNQACVRLGLGNPKTTHEKAYFHKSLPLACSLDGTVAGDDRTIMTDLDQGVICVNADKITLSGMGVVEAKLTAHEIESADQLPLYRGPLQLQMQMDITGAKWGAVCVLYRGTTLKTFLYERDEETIAHIHIAITDFQRRLDKYKTNDEIEWYDITSPEEASRIFNEAEKTEVNLPEVEQYAEKIIEFREMIRDLESKVSAYETKIMDEMRDNQYAISGRYKISWPMINYKAVPEKVFPAKEARSIRQSKLRIRDREINDV
jgi:predicted phage-related endonuclease